MQDKTEKNDKMYRKTMDKIKDKLKLQDDL